jgi:DNA repair ATPase RecN
MHCLNPKCDHEVTAQRGTRKFCSDACRQAYFRERHAARLTEMLTNKIREVEALREQVEEQAQTIEEQARRIADLEELLAAARVAMAALSPASVEKKLPQPRQKATLPDGLYQRLAHLCSPAWHGSERRSGHDHIRFHSCCQRPMEDCTRHGERGA